MKKTVKNGIRVATKAFEGYETLCVRGSTKVRCSRENIVRYALDLERKGEWDDLYESGFIVEEVGYSQVLYMSYRSPVYLKKRDFCLLRMTHEEESYALVVNCSIVHPKVPTRKNYVRANLQASGFMIRTSQNDPEVCDVVYIVQMDPNGSVPSLIKESGEKHRANLLKVFRDNLEKTFVKNITDLP